MKKWIARATLYALFISLPTVAVWGTHGWLALLVPPGGLVAIGVVFALIWLLGVALGDES